MSKTNSLEPDSEKFPKFSQAKYIDVTVKEGEMLFIPIYWWHAITNEDLNMAAVSYWTASYFNRVPPKYLTTDYVWNVSKYLWKRMLRIPNKVLKVFGIRS